MGVVGLILGRSSEMVNGWLRRLMFIIVMVSMLVWGSRDAGPVFPSIVEMGLLAGQNVLAGLNHVFGERKLLAVENKEIALLIICLLARPASLLNFTDLVFLVMNSVFDLVNLF